MGCAKKCCSAIPYPVLNVTSLGYHATRISKNVFVFVNVVVFVSTEIAEQSPRARARRLWRSWRRGYSGVVRGLARLHYHSVTPHRMTMKALHHNQPNPTEGARLCFVVLTTKHTNLLCAHEVPSLSFGDASPNDHEGASSQSTKSNRRRTTLLRGADHEAHESALCPRSAFTVIR